MFSEEEKKILENFVSNVDGNIFVLKNLPEVVKGALFARYSRSTKSLKRLLLDEFLTEVKEREEWGEEFDREKAERFYDKLLLGFGDDSVGELAGVHVALENISNIATKFVEDGRIGLSPLEKSTRYVYFDEKIDGKYQFHREKKIMESEYADTYEEACNSLFDIYSELIPKINKYFEERIERNEGVSERAYQASLRAKSCDVLRGLLPASTLTNVGIFGNGRAFEYLLVKMYASPLTEIRELAEKLYNELMKTIPSFVKRAKTEHGLVHQQYLSEKEKEVEKVVGEILKNEIKDSESKVELVEYEREAEIKVAAFIIHHYSQLSLKEAMEKAKNLSNEEIKKLIKAYVGKRKNRRHKPGRAFETIHYSFDCISNFGAYRDIHRHRILTQERQLLTTRLGYDMPKELVESGYESRFKEGMEIAKNAFEEIEKKLKYEAQYVVPFAYRIRWYMHLNLREAYHLCELRSARQGHKDYRKIAQQIYEEIKKVHPLLAEEMVFVDMNDYELERLEAEKKLDKKIEEIRKKYGGE